MPVPNTSAPYDAPQHAIDVALLRALWPLLERQRKAQCAQHGRMEASTGGFRQIVRGQIRWLARDPWATLSVNLRGRVRQALIDRKGETFVSDLVARNTRELPAWVLPKRPPTPCKPPEQE